MLSLLSVKLGHDLGDNKLAGGYVQVMHTAVGSDKVAAQEGTTDSRAFLTKQAISGPECKRPRLGHHRVNTSGSAAALLKYSPSIGYLSLSQACRSCIAYSFTG